MLKFEKANPGELSGGPRMIFVEGPIRFVIGGDWDLDAEAIIVIVINVPC